MEPLLIRGVPVQFPFEPYDIQRVYMEKVITCLQEGVNGILESPTGTGKTLCLLCATLAWSESVRAEVAASLQDRMKCDPQLYASLGAQLQQASGSGWKTSGGAPASSVVGAPKIIFASRTHSQLSQVVQELKRTAYSYVRATVIGSRDQLCTHPEVSKELNNHVKVHMCQAKVKSRSCVMYNQVDIKRNDKRVVEATVLDIEDLVGVGKQLNFCPYYMARSLREVADIVFMPYNYLLDPKTRKANGVELQNSIVILDEAHNIEKMCEDSASLQFKSTDIALCVEELTHVLTQLVSPEASGDIEFGSQASALATAAELNSENIMLLKAMLLELEKVIDDIPIRNPAEGASFPGSYMFELLEKAQIVHSKRSIIVEELDRVISFLTSTATSVFSRRGTGLQKFGDLIKVVFNRDNFSLAHMERVKKCYKVHVGFDQTKPTKRQRNDPWQSAAAPKKPQCRVLSYWCFSSGFGMADLMEQGVKSVILTSGTLAPLGAFVSELQVPMPISLENPHIIDSDQVWVGCVRRGPDGTQLSSSYANRSNPKYINSLGQTIVNISRLVPDGLLVFFPSYSMLKSCSEAWQMSGVWGRMAASKTVFSEPNTKDEFNQSMRDYYQHVVQPAEGARGACFMAVCRGKVSEGLDFADRNGRAVVITGLPYPPLKDPRVVLKRQYLDECRAEAAKSKGAVAPGLSGQEWYTLEASRAINQAVGRVIRHRRDYGAVILCDSRLADVGFSKQLSAWIQPYLKAHNSFGPVVRELTAFFRSCEVKYPCAAGPASTTSSKSSTGPSYAAFAFTASRSVAATSSSQKSGGTSNSGLEQINMKKIYGSIGGKSTGVPEPESAPLFEHMVRWDGNDKATKVANGGVSSYPLTDSTKENCAAAKSPAVRSGSKYKLTSNPAARLLQPSSPPSSSATSSNVVSAEEPPPSKKRCQDNQRKTAEYILSAKRVLKTDDYKTFSQAIKMYNRTRDYQELVTSLASVLVTAGDPHLLQLFRGFSVFVRSEHRSQFSETCRSLTGADCSS